MMVSPERQIKIGDKPYSLDSNFKTLRAIQHAFNQDILQVQIRILDMRQDEIARLIALGSGGNEEEIGQALFDEFDITSTEYQFLKAELLAWLAVAMTPKRDREKKSQQMAELIADLHSPGPSTKSSASVSFDGPPETSGKATSGKSPTPTKATPPAKG